jgi:hypothetical protein
VSHRRISESLAIAKLPANSRETAGVRNWNASPSLGFSFPLSARGFEAPDTSAPNVANGGGNDANRATEDDAKQRGVSASDAEAALIRALDRGA